MKIYGKVVRVERLRSTKNGNPRFCFVAECDNLGEMHITTANDLMLSYSVTEHDMVGRDYMFYCDDKGRAKNWELLDI